ncbi:hypothetical protein [Clostridium tagluense]|uniref:hypothetical protein n=1 Tax=Clostridium tagluense TaxID=360422 RepID=UPI001CF16653|nr:hypothetical protein [Clostridium tagluense]MCB2300944.1 hypothetical protein [Clostridium tagluense]
MAIKNVEIQDDTGTIYYPHTNASVVKCANGQSVEMQFAENVKQIGNINDQSLDATLKGKSLTEMTKVLFTNANNGKTAVANALVAKGVSALTTDTFTVLASKINAITFDASKLLTGNTVMAIAGTMLNRVTMASDASHAGLGDEQAVIGRFEAPLVWTKGNHSIFLNVPKGYYDETVYIYKSDPNYISANIKAGVSIFGVPGKTSVIDTASASAVDNEILVGNTAGVNGSMIVGTMPNNGAINRIPTTSSQSIPAGYTTGGIVSAVSVPTDKVLEGTVIAGAKGTLVLRGTAIASDIISGKTAYNTDAETKITGTMTVESLGGKRYASGSIDVPQSSTTIKVSGLAFKPTAVFIRNNSGSCQTQWNSLINNDAYMTDSIYPTRRISTVNIDNTTYPYVAYGEFFLPIGINSWGTVQWMAFS